MDEVKERKKGKRKKRIHLLFKKITFPKKKKKREGE